MTDDRFLQLDGRPSLRIERHFPHPIETVWLAVTTPEHLSAWFPSPVEIELRPGGAMRFSGHEGADGRGTVEAVDPPSRLVFTWGTDRLTFELAPVGDGTDLVLLHSFDDRYGAPSFATGWGECLRGLRSVLAGEPVPESDRSVERHEALVHEFRLDRPEVSESDGRWTVRVERQLTCPAEVAWDLWFGNDPDTGDQRSAPAAGEPLTPYHAPHVVVGTVTDVDVHRLLAFDVSPTGGPGEHVRLELGPGTGHGVRVTLTVTGVDPADRDAAVEVWGTGAVGHLAASGAEWALAHPVGA